MNTRKLSIIISAALVITSVITGVVAFMSQSKSADNLFAIGDIKVTLAEGGGWEKDAASGKYYMYETDVSGNKTTQKSFNSGDTGIPKSPYLVNASDSNPAWAFIVVEIPAQAAADTVSLDGSNVDIAVSAYCIQKDYKGLKSTALSTVTPVMIWNEFKADVCPGYTKVTDAASRNVNDVFWIDGNEIPSGSGSDSWTLLDSEGALYESESSYKRVYVYAYNTLLQPGTTTDSPFTSVSISSAIH